MCLKKKNYGSKIIFTIIDLKCMFYWHEVGRYSVIWYSVPFTFSDIFYRVLVWIFTPVNSHSGKIKISVKLIVWVFFLAAIIFIIVMLFI